MKVDYSKLAQANAEKNRRALVIEGQTLCPATGERLLSQKQAAQMLGISPRRLRELEVPTYSSAGRGHPTMYHAATVSLLRAHRKERRRDRPRKPTPIEAFLGGEFRQGDFEAFQPMLAIADQIPETALALAGGDTSQRHIDQTGAQKLVLLAREMQRVLREHCAVVGVHGEDPTGGHDPDPAPVAQTWGFEQLGGEIEEQPLEV